MGFVQLLPGVEAYLCPDVLREGAELNNMQFGLDLAAWTQPLLYRQATTTASVPPACFHSKTVTTDTKPGKRDSMCFIVS